MLTDTFRHKGLRKQLVDGIRKKGIKDEGVLKAIMKIPRHYFMDSSFLEYAYEDKPFPIGSGQTISQPYTVAFQTELLEIKKSDKVLEVGTGSGYQACVLMEMGAKVFTIERQRNLYRKTQQLFNDLRYKPKLYVYGDGYKGIPSYAPFQKIIVTAGAPFIPEELINQLAIGGYLVIPVGKGTQIMKRLIKNPDGCITEEEHGVFKFVPLLGDRAND